LVDIELDLFGRSHQHFWVFCPQGLKYLHLEVLFRLLSEEWVEFQHRLEHGNQVILCRWEGFFKVHFIFGRIYFFEDFGDIRVSDETEVGFVEVAEHAADGFELVSALGPARSCW